MTAGLRLMLTLWIAATLAVAPFAAARAAPCLDHADQTSAPTRHHAGHAMAGERTVAGHHAATVQAGHHGAPSVDHLRHAVAACCAAFCVGAALLGAGPRTDTVLAPATRPGVAEARLPDGIAVPPQLGPPRLTL